MDSCSIQKLLVHCHEPVWSEFPHFHVYSTAHYEKRKDNVSRTVRTRTSVPTAKRVSKCRVYLCNTTPNLFPMFARAFKPEILIRRLVLAQQSLPIPNARVNARMTAHTRKRTLSLFHANPIKEKTREGCQKGPIFLCAPNQTRTQRRIL